MTSDHNAAKVDESKSTPERIELTDGSYILWDKKDGFYRVAHFQKTARKGSDLEMTLSLAMKKPIHNFRVRNVLSYIEKSEYATSS
jgi:uncharacterized protein YcgL (UPF0745 family)